MGEAQGIKGIKISLNKCLVSKSMLHPYWGFCNLEFSKIYMACLLSALFLSLSFFIACWLLISEIQIGKEYAVGIYIGLEYIKLSSLLNLLRISCLGWSNQLTQLSCIILLRLHFLSGVFISLRFLRKVARIIPCLSYDSLSFCHFQTYLWTTSFTIRLPNCNLMPAFRSSPHDVPIFSDLNIGSEKTGQNSIPRNLRMTF